MSAFKKPEFDDLLLMQSEALQLDLSGSEYLEIDVLNEKIKEYSSRIMSLESKYFNFSQLKEIDISQEIYTDLSSFLKARSSAFLNFLATISSSKETNPKPLGSFVFLSSMMEASLMRPKDEK